MISKIQYDILKFIYTDYDDPISSIDLLNMPFYNGISDPTKTSRILEDLYNHNFIDTYDSREPYSIRFLGSVHLTHLGRQAIIDYDIFVIREQQLQSQIESLKALVETAKNDSAAAKEDAIFSRKQAKCSNRMSIASLIISASALVVSTALHFI